MSRRVTDRRPLRQRFLIMCEGERTEPNYFKRFRVPKEIRVKIIGQGYSTVKLVRSALRLMQGADYDQVWCVFDRDEFPVEQFNEALRLARENHIKVAYSNQSFEIWYLLHFDYHNTPTTRQRYKEILTDRLETEYRKNDSDLYYRLEPLQATAIRNAERLLQWYAENHDPARDDPCTTVHHLVQELNRFTL